MDNNSSKLIKFVKSGEMENINKPNANKTNEFLVEPFILFTF